MYIFSCTKFLNSNGKILDGTSKDSFAKAKSLFALANESLDVPSSIFPFEFKNLVQEKIYKLIQYKFAEYLNLLYIIDVPEEQIKKLDGSDLVELSEQVAFLVLKREWQKVWFRNKY